MSELQDVLREIEAGRSRGDRMALAILEKELLAESFGAALFDVAAGSLLIWTEWVMLPEIPSRKRSNTACNPLASVMAHLQSGDQIGAGASALPVVGHPVHITQG